MINQTQMIEKLQDSFGGISAAFVLLPRNMAFGLLIFLPFGPEYAPLGVAAGLMSLIVANAVSSLFGSVRIMTVSTFSLSALIMMSMNEHFMNVLTAEGIEQPANLAIPLCFIAAMFSGAFQALFGLLKLGNLAKYIPHPVLTGVLNGTGLAIVSSQLHVILTDSAGGTYSMPTLLLLSVAAITILMSLIGPKLNASIPGIFYGIAAGTAGFYALSYLYSSQEIGTVVGALPDQMFSLGFAESMALSTQSTLTLSLMPTVIIYGLAIGAADTMRSALSCLIVDLKTNERSDFNRELIAEGLGNIMAAPFGAITSTGNATGAITNHVHGGRTWISRASIGAILLITVMYFDRYLAATPIVVLASVMIVMTALIMDFSFLRDLKQQMTYPDQDYSRLNTNLALEFFTAFIVVGVDLFAALAFGVLVSIALLVINMTKNVVRNTYTARQLESNVGRRQLEQDILNHYGDRTTFLELEGALFFGTADQLHDILDPILNSKTEIVILDLRLVTQIDQTAVEILIKLNDLWQQAGKSFILSSLNADIAEERFQELTHELQNERFCCFTNVEDSIAWAESEILRKKAPDVFNTVDLSDVDGIRFMGSQDIAWFREYLTIKHCEKGESLIRKGSRDNSVFFITAGEALVGIKKEAGFTRYATVRAGSIIGEISLFDQAPRSADVIANTDLTCYCLTAYNLKKMRIQHPGAAYDFVVGLTLIHAEQLREDNTKVVLA